MIEPMDMPEARVVVVGDAVEEAAALFAGTLDDARVFVAALSTAERNAVAIVTDGRIYAPDEL